MYMLSTWEDTLIQSDLTLCTVIIFKEPWVIVIHCWVYTKSDVMVQQWFDWNSFYRPGCCVNSNDQEYISEISQLKLGQMYVKHIYIILRLWVCLPPWKKTLQENILFKRISNTKSMGLRIIWKGNNGSVIVKGHFILIWDHKMAVLSRGYSRKQNGGGVAKIRWNKRSCSQSPSVLMWDQASCLLFHPPLAN